MLQIPHVFRVMPYHLTMSRFYILLWQEKSRVLFDRHFWGNHQYFCTGKFANQAHPVHHYQLSVFLIPVTMYCRVAVVAVAGQRSVIGHDWPLRCRKYNKQWATTLNLMKRLLMPRRLYHRVKFVASFSKAIKYQLFSDIHILCWHCNTPCPHH